MTNPQSLAAHHGFVQVDRRTGYKQFLAPSSVLDVDTLSAAVCFNLSDKAVGAADKKTSADIRIGHKTIFCPNL